MCNRVLCGDRCSLPITMNRRCNSLFSEPGMLASSRALVPVPAQGGNQVLYVDVDKMARLERRKLRSISRVLRIWCTKTYVPDDCPILQTRATLSSTPRCTLVRLPTKRRRRPTCTMFSRWPRLLANTWKITGWLLPTSTVLVRTVDRPRSYLVPRQATISRQACADQPAQIKKWAGIVRGHGGT